METSEYKRLVMWLLCLPENRREIEIQKLLDLLKLK